jgi:hypothetical protein
MSPDLPRHLLATIAYRFHFAVGDLDEELARRDPGAGARSCAGLTAHCVQVLHLARRAFRPDTPAPSVEESDWEELRRAFHRQLEALDGHLRRGDRPRDPDLTVLLQGPFADVLTHIGQMNLLRRLLGRPAPAQSYLHAPVRIGRVGGDQGPPVARRG